MNNNLEIEQIHTTYFLIRITTSSQLQSQRHGGHCCGIETICAGEGVETGTAQADCVVDNGPDVTTGGV